MKIRDLFINRMYKIQGWDIREIKKYFIDAANTSEISSSTKVRTTGNTQIYGRTRNIKI